MRPLHNSNEAVTVDINNNSGATKAIKRTGTKRRKDEIAAATAAMVEITAAMATNGDGATAAIKMATASAPAIKR